MIYMEKYIFAIAAFFYFTLPSLAQQQATKEEIAFAQRIYRAQERGNDKDFFQAEQEFMDYLEQRQDWEKYYNTWLNKVVYHVNNKHFYRAFAEIRNITDGIRQEEHSEYRYIPDFALGLYYVNRGQADIGAKYYKKALERMDTVNNSLAKVNIYMSLAQALSLTDKDQALSYLDSMPPIQKNAATESGVLAYRCIINFEKGDMKTFDKCYASYDSLRRNYPEEFNEINYENVMVRRSLQQKNYQAALNWCDSLETEEERAEHRQKVYEQMGYWEKAYREQTKKDSLHNLAANEVLQEDLEDLSHEIERWNLERDRIKATNQQYVFATILALLAILALTALLVYRHRTNQKLRHQNKLLQKAEQHTRQALAIRKAFVYSIQNRLKSPVSVLSGYARIFNTPGFNLTEEELKKGYTDIVNSGKVIETLLEPVLDSYIHNNASISDEQRKLCQEALHSPLNVMVCMAEMIVDDKDRTIPQSDYLEMRKEIGNNARQVAVSTHELITFSITDEGSEIAKKDRVGLNDIVASTLSGYNKRNTLLTTKFDSEVGEDTKIETSQSDLQEILLCLIGNADDFATGGAISVYCSQADNGSYSVSVANEGNPIPAEDSERIFQPFVKLNKTDHGLGLGLALARRLATSLGYTITLDQAFTQGARFVVSGL